MTRQLEANARTWQHGLHKRSKVLQKAQKGNQKGRSLLLKLGHSRTFADAFLPRLPGRLIHGQVNDTQKQACTHPRTTRTMEQVSDCLSGLVLVSRVSPDPGKRPFQTGSSAQGSFGGKLTSEFCTTQSLQFLDLGKSLHLGPRKSVRSPK
ncbi:hypothetical protein CRG98_021176 [Punica granatum]|uniref:Uncharacterized protein n=1 Tax=Punica granatum TaxID=22663 RepID=A0A2I0JQ41_PUNGR|nr:hypothetical protein CRG98_021176 [Punica granatum]